MGKYLHVAKRYEVEWGQTAKFNYSHEEFFDVLRHLGAEPSWYGGDCDIISDDFEVEVQNYDDAIKNLEVYISNPHLLSESDAIAGDIKRLKTTSEELLKTMKEYRAEADVRSGFLHFAAY